MSNKNLATLFQARIYSHGQKPWLGRLSGDGSSFMTFEESGRAVERMGRALMAAGVEAGARIGILSENRPEWVLADFASVSVGAVTVPLHVGILRDSLGEKLREGSLSILFVDNPDRLSRVLSLPCGPASLRKIVCFEGTSPPDGNWISLNDFLSSGDAVAPARFYERLSQVDPDSPAISREAGGADECGMTTHREVLSVSEAAANALPLRADDVIVSLLPLANGFGRTVGLLPSLILGAKTVHAPCGQAGAALSAELSPTVVFLRPAHLRDIHAEVLVRMRKRLGWARRWFVKVSAKGKPGTSFLSGSLERFYDRVFFEKVRSMFGGRIRFIVCAEGTPDPPVAAFFRRVGMEVRLLDEVSPPSVAA